MARLSLYLSVCLALSSIPAGLAGPACAKRHFRAANCVEVCKSRWGWSGAIMGTDPWGAVVKNADPAKALEDAIKEACGTSVISSGATATSSTVSQQTTSTAWPTEAVTSAIIVPSSSSVAQVTSSSPSPSVTSTSASSSLVVTSAATSTSVTSSSAAPTTSSFFASAQGFVGSIPSRSSTRITPITPSSTTSIRRTNPTTSRQPAQPANTVAASNAGGSTSDSDIQAYLSAHNTIRAQHGASPLTWNNDLAAKAQQWANGCQFKHSGGSLGAFGENLAAGTGSNYDIAAAVKSWTDEVSEYDPNNPQPSHFTQVVWKGTTQVGCAVQTCNGIFDASFGPAKYFVCEYSPQGNIIGRFAQNVQV
ncbi:CAP domain-containing protein [Panaeolus papilionaceus]|nr:CAP domain-containing protein [Panaeolus papilionaceus]